MRTIAFFLPLMLACSPLRAVSEPSWWHYGAADASGVRSGGIFSSRAPDNFAPANLGQLKNVAVEARRAMDAAYIADGKTLTQRQTLLATIDAMIALFQLHPVDGSNFAPINLGQLKNVAKPFYDRLIADGYDTRANLIASGYPTTWVFSYPWDPTTPNTENYKVANIGQLKAVFSFDPLYRKTVWLAVRTDGVAGTGTKVDPYDASTQPKFDALMRRFTKGDTNTVPGNFHILLGPGTFLTKGTDGNCAEDGFFLTSNIRLSGAGQVATTVKLSAFRPFDLNTPKGHETRTNYTITTAISTGGYYPATEQGMNIVAGNVVVEDLAVDCNGNTLGPSGEPMSDKGISVRGINNSGSNAVIRNVVVRHAYGTSGNRKTAGGVEIADTEVEGFAIISANPIVDPLTDTDVKGVMIDNATVEDTVTYQDINGEWVGANCSSITVGGGINAKDITAVVQNCHVNNNRWVAYAIGSKNSILRDSFATDCSYGYRVDSGGINGISIVGCTFTNIGRDCILFIPLQDNTSSWTNITISGNYLFQDSGPHKACIAFGDENKSLANQSTIAISSVNITNNSIRGSQVSAGVWSHTVAIWKSQATGISFTGNQVQSDGITGMTSFIVPSGGYSGYSESNNVFVP